MFGVQFCNVQCTEEFAALDKRGDAPFMGTWFARGGSKMKQALCCLFAHQWIIFGGGHRIKTIFQFINRAAGVSEIKRLKFLIAFRITDDRHKGRNACAG